jgi:signal transduction histidine kinase
MKSAPHGFLPLAPDLLQRALSGRVVVPSTDGRTVALLFPANSHIVAVQIDAASLFPSAGTADALLTTPAGYLLALGSAWSSAPNQAALAFDGLESVSRIVDTSDGSRLFSLRRLSGWPLAVGSSVGVGEALDAWYGGLPLYLFFILGPAFAGAGLAVVFVREFERRARSAESERALRATRPEEARLLVRLAEAERRAVDAERAKSQFMAHMSHELRTPLNAIIGFSEVIERGVFGTPHPKYIEYARDISSAGRQLHTRIGDTLEFAELQARKRTIATESVDVSAIARLAIDEIAASAFQRGVRLTVSLADKAPAQGDAIAVRRILDNLLSNAVQYTPKGGTVRVQLREEGSFVVAQIRDTGLGFSTEEKARAGESFRRFDRPGSTTGLGLGLTIATTLARRMGATLRIASTQGEGTTIELRLPRAVMGKVA